MLREETAKLLMMIQGAYPNYKRSFGDWKLDCRQCL